MLYEQLVEDYWRTYLPSRVEALEDPPAYFRTLAQEIEQEIQEQTARLAGEDLPGEDYLGKVGRLTQARNKATEIVLHDRVYSQGKEPETVDLEPPLRKIPGAHYPND